MNILSRSLVPACVAGLLLGAAGPVAAHDPGKAGQRAVMECRTDAATRRAYAREHGHAAVYLTARQVQSARASNEVWASPRCMTAREYARLTQAMADNARAR